MQESLIIKTEAKTASEICQHYRLSRTAQKLLRAELSPSSFVELLIQAEQYGDVFDFLAHVLPKREAIWWACLSVRHAQGSALAPNEFEALKAAVEWVLEPDEPKRRAAQSAGEKANFGTPAGCAALAVYGSGGSLGPAIFPDVKPGPYMTAQAVSGSITMASVQGDPRLVHDVRRELAELGIAIAQGKFKWPAVTKALPRPDAAGNARGNRF